MSNENAHNNQHDILLNTPENQTYDPIPMEVDFINDFDNLNMNDSPSFRYIRKHVSADNSSTEEENPSLVSVESLPVLRKRKKDCVLKNKTSKKRRRSEHRKSTEGHKRRHRRRYVRRLLDFGSDSEHKVSNRPPTPYPEDNNSGRRRLRAARPSKMLKAKSVPHVYSSRLSPVPNSETCCSYKNVSIPLNKNVDNNRSDSSN